MTRLPKWATPERRERLVRLFERSRGFCVFGHDECPNADHHYELFIEGLVREWVSEDASCRVWAWKAEREWMHRGPTRFTQGVFDTITREQQQLDRPEYYLVRLGVSPFTYRQVAVVRVAGTFEHLFVEVGVPVRTVGKVKRRKAARYGKGLSEGAMRGIHALCRVAVRDWMRKHGLI